MGKIRKKGETGTTTIIASESECDWGKLNFCQKSLIFNIILIYGTRNEWSMSYIWIIISFQSLCINADHVKANYHGETAMFKL